MELLELKVETDDVIGMSKVDVSEASIAVGLKVKNILLVRNSTYS